MHPNSLDLEAFAVGEGSAVIEAHLAQCEPCRTFIERARGLPASTKPTRRLAPIVAVVLPLAAAALFFVLPRQPAPGGGAARPVTPSQTGEPDTTFKGTLPIAVVRERSGGQMRFTTSAGIRPGDRLRVEVALDREQVISAGVLGDDGSWLELMPESSRGAGTHFSEKSARVDADPMRGTVLVGSPSQVALARSTRDFAHVAAIRLDWEAP